VLTDHRGVVALRNVLPAALTDQPVWAMQAIDPRHPSWRSSSIEEIASACLETMRRTWPCGPYRLGGHSLGGLVAFEMALRFEQAGERVDRLVLFDTVAPAAFRWRGRIARRRRIMRDEPPLRRLRAYSGLARYAAENAWSLARGMPPPPREWPRGFDDPFDRAGADRLMRRYRPQRLAGRVVILSTSLSVAETGAPDLGWRTHVRGPITVRPVPGDHTTMFTEPYVRALASELAEELGHDQ
jgi:thioesterase domain-containing protein